MEKTASLIVRTVGRPTLGRALDAIAAQTHRPIDIVLVDAAATGIAIESHGGVPVRVVGRGRLDRPRAANAGLEAARGAWLGFLDEDDEIDPAHVASLLAAVELTGHPAAYSQTRLLDATGRTTRVFGGPWQREALLRSNFLAIHAVLFSRRFVDQGLRFDEALATFEDWDFWLQLSAHADLAFTGRPTAAYCASDGTSGAGSGANLDADAVRAQRDRLMRKWLPA